MPLPRRGRGQRGVVLDVAWGSTWHVGGCRPRRFSAHIPRGGEVRQARGLRSCHWGGVWFALAFAGVAFGGVLVLVVGVFVVVGVVIQPCEVTAGGDGVSWVVRERVGCDDSNGGGGGGKEEAMWQRLRTVSSFGWARPLGPRVGYIYLNPFLYKALWLSWLECS